MNYIFVGLVPFNGIKALMCCIAVSYTHLQYQHDVTPKRLDESLAGVVEDSVNKVGVDLNTATPSLLTYIAGINASIANNIVAYRDEVGGFKTRKELLKVKRLGQKAYEQCAGCLLYTSI